MSDRSPSLPRTLFVAGVLAGAVVGLLDGVRAGWQGHADATGLVASAFFVLGLDALVGAVLGAVGALATVLARWGRAVRPALVPRIGGWILAGALTAAATGAAVAGTAARNNRFLAAGVVCLAALGAGVGGALVGPALARLLAAGRGARDEARPSPLGLLVVSPAAALLLAVAMFVPVWYARSPVRGSRLWSLAIPVAALSALLPAALALASGVARRVRVGVALVFAFALFVVPAGAIIWLRWTRDFQFVRWSDAIVVAAIAALAAGPLRPQVHRLARRRAWTAAGGVALGGLLLVLVAGASEPARKATAAHAGLVSPFLDAARIALDFDHDGYTRLLGGGDCDDHDPQINPGAQEWPDDGIDQDCDGRDATAAAIRSPALHPVPASVPPDLNLLLVTIDTLRADHMSCYGYRRPTSPQIDRLAAESTLFENGWAHAPSTRYSMPAIATGRWPSTIAWDESIWWPRIARDQRTIGEALKAQGYATGALYAYSYFHRADARGFERGIDDYQDHRAALHVNVNGPMESVGSSSREMADDAIAFFDAHKGDKFFLWLHFYDPHLSYERHPEAPAFGNRPADLYDGEIWYTDHHFGRVLERLRALGLWDRTAIVLTGDHGEGLGEHDIQAHGYHLYGPQTKVPFIVRVPGASARRVTTPVGHVDIAPTLVNLARGPHEDSFLGRSMLDLVLGTPSATVPTRPVFQEVTYESATSMNGTKRRALVTDAHHLIWNWTPDNTTECYDLRSDPGELHDLWGKHAGAACESLKRSLKDMVQVVSLPSGFAEKVASAVTAPGGQAPRAAHPLEATFGTSVQFEGFDLATPVVSRGADAEIVYHFEARAPVPAGWRPFFHLEGPGGFRNIDHVPVEGAYPVERWRAGMHIRDRQRITFPPSAPPGVYTIYAGFFRGAERMPITPAQATDGNNRLRITTITVQ